MSLSDSIETPPSHLVERVPEDLAETWRNNSAFWWRLVLGGMLAMFLPIGVAVVWLPFRHAAAGLQLTILVLASLVFLVTWSVAVYLLAALARAGWAHDKFPIVRICQGIVTVDWKGEKIEEKVSECGLRIGRAWQMKYASRKSGGIRFGVRDLILIDLPPLYRDMFGGLRSYTTVAVGYTDESLQRWSEALGMEIVKPQQSRRRPN